MCLSVNGLTQLHSYGLLAGSFRPTDQVCVFRSYIRQPDNLIKSACVHIQRMRSCIDPNECTIASSRQ